MSGLEQVPVDVERLAAYAPAMYAFLQRLDGFIRWRPPYMQEAWNVEFITLMDDIQGQAEELADRST